DLRSVDDFVGGPDERRLAFLCDADDAVQEGMDVLVDAQRIRPDRLGQLAVLDDVRIGDDSAGEVAGAQPVDWIRVPDAADVETVADEAADGLGRFDVAGNDDVRRVNSGLGAEVAAAAPRETEAVARD